MKRILVLVLLMANVVAYAQRKPKIKGNREVMEVKEELPYFNAVRLDDNLEVFLQQGETEGYELLADDNLIDVLKFRVENETLIIGSFYAIKSKKKLSITIIFNRLHSIHLTAGRILVRDKFTTDDLDVIVAGTGKLELAVNAEVFSGRFEGSGYGNLNVECGSLDVAATDKSKLKLFTMAEEATIGMNRNATAVVEGFADNFTVDLKDQAGLKGMRLEAGMATATLKGNASAELLVVRALELYASGASKTYFYGSGKIVLQEFLDTAELYRRKN